MATLSKQQVADIIKKAPAGTTPEGIVAALREKGYTLEGYQDTPQSEVPQSQTQKAPGFVQGMAQTVAKPFLKLTSNLFEASDNLLAAGSYALGDTERANRINQQIEARKNEGINYGYFGKVKPVETVKDAIGTGAELASYFVGGGGLKTVAQQGFKGAILGATKAGAKFGAVGGAAQGFGSGLQEEESTFGNVAVDTLKGGVGGLAGGAVLGGIGGALGATSRGIVGKVSGYIDPEVRAKQALDEAIEITRPVLDKKDTIAAFKRAGKEGGITSRGELKKFEYIPSKKDVAVADSVRNIVSKNNGPLDNIANINNEIERVAESEVRPFLQENQNPFNLFELEEYLGRTKIPQLFKTDKALSQTYARVRKEVLKVAARYSNNLEGLWDARKEIDDMIERQFGDAVFGTPQYSAVKRAAIDMRNGINNFIAESLSSVDMQKVNKIQDLISTMRQRGILLDSVEDAAKQLKSYFGIPETEDDILRAAFFRDRMSRMSNMYEAVDNLAEQNYKLRDKNSIDRWLKQNPGKARLIRGGGIALLGAAGLGGANIVLNK